MSKRFLSSVPSLLILLAVLAVFGRVLGNEFVDWDDPQLIWQNPNFNPPTIAGLAHHWNPTDPANVSMYMPVINTTWWLLAHVADPQWRAGMFHAASLLAHLLSALLVMRILWQLVGNRTAALAGALLFALHPLQTEAVAWATGLKDTLSGMLALLAIWQYVLLLKAKDWPLQRGHGLVSLLAFALALLAKPSVVVVPLMLLVVHAGFSRRYWWLAMVLLVPWFVLGAAGALLAKLMQPAIYVDAGALWVRPWIALDSLSFYLSKLFAPVHLTFDYGRSPAAVLNDPTHPLWWTWIFPAGIAVALIGSGNRAWRIGGLLFVLGVLPMLGLTAFVFQYYSTVADRYVYLAMLGPALVLAAALARWPGKPLQIPTAIVLLTLAVLSYQQAGVWADSQTLAAHGLAMNPNSFAALTIRGATYPRQYLQAVTDGDPAAVQRILAMAESDARRYLTLNALNPIGYEQLVWTLEKQKRYPEAADVIRRQMAVQLRMPKPMQRDPQILQQRLEQQLNAAALQAAG